MQVARTLRARCAQFVLVHAHPVVGPAGWRRIARRVRPPAPLALEVVPAVDLEEEAALQVVADEETGPHELVDRGRHLALGDLRAHLETHGPDRPPAAGRS